MTVPPFFTPVPIDLGRVYRGDTIVLPLWIALDYYGEVIDLTGATVWFTAKTDLALADNDAGVLRYSTASTGVEIGEPTDGEYQVTIAALDTVSLESVALYIWDVQVRTPDGTTITVARGTISFDEDVTRTVA